MKVEVPVKISLELVPTELEEAAMMDGCFRFVAFVKITLPSSLPGTFTI